MGSSSPYAQGLPAPEEVAAGLFRLVIPIPVPLRYVNAYLIEGTSGWTVVDTGFHTPEAEACWQRTFQALGLRPTDLEQIVVTHYHPDHLGCAGWLQGLSGAPVIMLVHEQPQVKRFWASDSTAGEAIAGLFARHGMPAAVTGIIPDHHREQVRRVHPLPRIQWIHPGDVLTVGRRRFEVIWAPGHAEGLMVLWEPEENLLLADDLVLATITPNVSLWPYSVENPLRQFLSSLDRIAALPARLVLPGHRQIITHLQQRVAELVRHHDQRLRRVEQIVEEQAAHGGLPPSGWQVNLELFGVQEDPFAVRFAMAESLAHLEYLVEEGQLRRVELDGTVRYAPKPRRT